MRGDDSITAQYTRDAFCYAPAYEANSLSCCHCVWWCYSKGCVWVSTDRWVIRNRQCDYHWGWRAVPPPSLFKILLLCLTFAASSSFSYQRHWECSCLPFLLPQSSREKMISDITIDHGRQERKSWSSSNNSDSKTAVQSLNKTVSESQNPFQISAVDNRQCVWLVLVPETYLDDESTVKQVLVNSW